MNGMVMINMNHMMGERKARLTSAATILLLYASGRSSRDSGQTSVIACQSWWATHKHMNLVFIFHITHWTKTQCCHSSAKLACVEIALQQIFHASIFILGGTWQFHMLVLFGLLPSGPCTHGPLFLPLHACIQT
jgi:hypothetical protein